MARISYEERKQLIKDLGVKKLWSYSAINSFYQDRWEYFLSRIKYVEKDQCNSIYALLGGVAHDSLEMYYKNEISYEDMIDRFDTALAEATITGKKFNRNDVDNNAKLQANYEANMRHFFLNHQKPNWKMKNEANLLINFREDVYLTGYLDLTAVVGDELHIIDFKSSTIYTGKDLQEKSLQLYIYLIGLRQEVEKRGGKLPLEKFKVGYNFLKYVNVHITKLNGSVTTRRIERRKIGKELQKQVKAFMTSKVEEYRDVTDEKTGKVKSKKIKVQPYDDFYIEECMQELEKTNDIQHLPCEIKERFVIEDCWVYCPISEEILEETKQWVLKGVDEITAITNEYYKTKDENLFMYEIENDSDAYYAAILCEYSTKLHKPYANYLEKKAEAKLNETRSIIDTPDNAIDNIMGNSLLEGFDDIKPCKVVDIDKDKAKSIEDELLSMM